MVPAQLYHFAGHIKGKGLKMSTVESKQWQERQWVSEIKLEHTNASLLKNVFTVDPRGPTSTGAMH